jgi:uncharacterized protein (TIGR03083 family)
MADLDYLGAIHENADRLVDAAEGAGLDAPVPSCPGWLVADLLAHIGRVHRMAAGNVRRAEPEEMWPGEIEIPDAEARLLWVREGAGELLAALRAASPDAPAWTFGGPPAVAGFWFRRQAHETAVHRVDAELAAGEPTPIDAELAADGVDEMLELFSHRSQPIVGNDDTIHLHCTDVEGEWLVRLTPTGLEFERVHAKGDAAARGSATDLLTWLTGRTPIERLEVLGDAALPERWRARAHF